MNVPIIRDTTCPSSDDLARDYSMVFLSSVPSAAGVAPKFGTPIGATSCGYIGRLVSLADGVATVLDPFVFQTEISARQDGNGMQVVPQIFFFMAPGCANRIDVLSVQGVMKLSDMPSIVCKSIRESLISSWEGRETIRRRDAGIETDKARLVIP